mgnify:CR=1 FL=1
MRACTKRGECFSFSFMSYSYERRKSNGVVRVEHAQLRKQSRKEHNRFADYKAKLHVIVNIVVRIMLPSPLLEFNGHELELK